MAGLFYDPELEARKKVLVAECEIYRQTLSLELHNLRLYSVAMRRRLSPLRWVQPAMAVVAPLAGLWFSSRRAKAERLPGLLGKVLLGWRLYQKYGHFVRNLFPGASRDGRPAGSGPGLSEAITALRRG